MENSKETYRVTKEKEFDGKRFAIQITDDSLCLQGIYKDDILIAITDNQPYFIGLAVVETNDGIFIRQPILCHCGDGDYHLIKLDKAISEKCVKSSEVKFLGRVLRNDYFEG